METCCQICYEYNKTQKTCNHYYNLDSVEWFVINMINEADSNNSHNSNNILITTKKEKVYENKINVINLNCKCLKETFFLNKYQVCSNCLNSNIKYNSNNFVNKENFIASFNKNEIFRTNKSNYVNYICLECNEKFCKDCVNSNLISNHKAYDTIWDEVKAISLNSDNVSNQLSAANNKCKNMFHNLVHYKFFKVHNNFELLFKDAINVINKINYLRMFQIKGSDDFLKYKNVFEKTSSSIYNEILYHNKIIKGRKLATLSCIVSNIEKNTNKLGFMKDNLTNIKLKNNVSNNSNSIKKDSYSNEIPLKTYLSEEGMLSNKCLYEHKLLNVIILNNVYYNNKIDSINKNKVNGIENENYNKINIFINNKKKLISIECDIISSKNNKTEDNNLDNSLKHKKQLNKNINEEDNKSIVLESSKINEYSEEFNKILGMFNKANDRISIVMQSKEVIKENHFNNVHNNNSNNNNNNNNTKADSSNYSKFNYYTRIVDYNVLNNKFNKVESYILNYPNNSNMYNKKFEDKEILITEDKNYLINNKKNTANKLKTYNSLKLIPNKLLNNKTASLSQQDYLFYNFEKLHVQNINYLENYIVCCFLYDKFSTIEVFSLEEYILSSSNKQKVNNCSNYDKKHNKKLNLIKIVCNLEELYLLNSFPLKFSKIYNSKNNYNKLDLDSRNNNNNNNLHLDTFQKIYYSILSLHGRINIVSIPDLQTIYSICTLDKAFRSIIYNENLDVNFDNIDSNYIYNNFEKLCYNSNNECSDNLSLNKLVFSYTNNTHYICDKYQIYKLEENNYTKCINLVKTQFVVEEISEICSYKEYLIVLTRTNNSNIRIYYRKDLAYIQNVDLNRNIKLIKCINLSAIYNYNQNNAENYNICNSPNTVKSNKNISNNKSSFNKTIYDFNLLKSKKDNYSNEYLIYITCDMIMGFLSVKGILEMSSVTSNINEKQNIHVSVLGSFNNNDNNINNTNINNNTNCSI